MFFSENFDFGGGHSREERKVDNKTLYKHLELDPKCSQNEVKRSYHRLAKLNHPDKGGDTEKFKKIQNAFSVLGNPEKRDIYDRYGEAGLNQEAEGPGVNIFDLFSGRRRGPRKGEDTHFQLSVPLEDIYNQSIKQLKLTKKIVCKICKGKGSRSGKDITCTGCRGSGLKIRIQRLSASAMQQVQSKCDECDGSGMYIDPKDVCKACKGKKVIDEKKKIDVLIEKGIRSGHKVTFEREGDCRPGIIPGDVIVELIEKPHPEFKRDGLNLFYKKPITLSEALTGCRFSIKQLDGRTLTFDTNGKDITEKTILTVQGEGMPKHNNSFIKGVLFISFDIEYPKNNNLDKDNKIKLCKLLNQHPICKEEEGGCELELEQKSVKEVMESQKRMNFDSQNTEEGDEDTRHSNCPAM